MVGDKYLATCFRLAGVRTVITDNDDETARRLTELVENQEVEIAIITERVAMKLKAFRESLLKTGKSLPIFIIVPDFQGPLNERIRELRELVNRAVGMKLESGD
jgi:vacuolar-type H+-ATPase subunit F/Vma7